MRLLRQGAKVPSMDAVAARRWMEAKGDGGFTLLDVRQPEEYEAGHLPGALLIPLPELPERLGELDPTRPVLAY
ncbi:MAG: hypothetical protein Kow0092_38470 [Deferrisomatales bacterium]